MTKIYYDLENYVKFWILENGYFRNLEGGKYKIKETSGTFKNDVLILTY